MAAITSNQLIPESRESWITPDEQLDRLATPIVLQRLSPTKLDYKRLKLVFAGDQIVRSVTQSTLQALKGESERELKCFVSLETKERLSFPVDPLPTNLTNWYTTLKQIDFLPEKIPPLPSDICEILASPCPIYNTEDSPCTVGETHSLYLIPGGPLKDFTDHVSRYEDRVEKFKCRYDCFQLESGIKRSHEETDEPEWVLIANDLLPESRGHTYDEQVQMVEGLSERSSASYQVPTLKNMVTFLFLQTIATNTRQYENNRTVHPDTFTRVQERTKTRSMMVGGFSLKGLKVFSLSSQDDGKFIGITALRKLEANRESAPQQTASSDSRDAKKSRFY